MSRGFTLIEMLISLAIILVLLGLGLSAFMGARTTKQLDTITDSIAARLEEAKTNAMSGKGGTNFGLAFSSSTYTYWSGASYNAASPDNIVIAIPTNFILSSTIPGADHPVMFARITGLPNATGTVTIASIADASTSDTIAIGSLGDITVIK